MRAVKSVSIDSERRVIITYLDGSTETLYPNCIWCDSEALRQLIKDLLEEKADAITQTIENVTIASFADGADEGLIKKLLVGIEPIQEGEGDPSPENVRPISGRTGLTVSHSGADTSDPATISVNWQTEAGTVYGGTLDVVSGKLTVDRAFAVFDGSVDESWSWTTATNRASISLPLASAPDARNPLSNCNIGTYLASGHAVGGVFISNTKSLWYYPPTSVTDLASYRSWLSENNLQVVYVLAEPVVYQLTPQEITTLLGDNNIWADSGNILELEYTADTKLYIGEQQSGTLGSGIQTIIKPDLQRVSEKTLEDVTESYNEETTDERGEE